VRGQRQGFGALAPARGQGTGQRVGLEAFKHEDRVHRVQRQRAIEHVGRLRRGGGPDQRQAGHGGLESQRASFSAGHHRRHRGGPGQALVGRVRRRQRGQLRGRLHQGAGQHVTLRAQAGALQQVLGQRQVACGVKTQVIRTRAERCQLPGPVAGGLEAWRKAIRDGRPPTDGTATGMSCAKGSSTSVRAGWAPRALRRCASRPISPGQAAMAGCSTGGDVEG
jgi:hypothetical protein